MNPKLSIFHRPGGLASEKGGKFVLEQVVKTPAGARTEGMDETANKLYLPTAEFEPIRPDAAPGRPQPRPGTFRIVVVSQAQ